MCRAPLIRSKLHLALHGSLRLDHSLSACAATCIVETLVSCVKEEESEGAEPFERASRLPPIGAGCKTVTIVMLFHLVPSPVTTPGPPLHRTGRCAFARKRDGARSVRSHTRMGAGPHRATGGPTSELWRSVSARRAAGRHAPNQ